MKLKLEPCMKWSEELDDEVPVPNVYDRVAIEDGTEEGKTLMEYYSCGSHAFYISPKVIALLERSEL